MTHWPRWSKVQYGEAVNQRPWRSTRWRNQRRVQEVIRRRTEVTCGHNNPHVETSFPSFPRLIIRSYSVAWTLAIARRRRNHKGLGCIFVADLELTLKISRLRDTSESFPNFCSSESCFRRYACESSSRVYTLASFCWSIRCLSGWYCSYHLEA